MVLFKSAAEMRRRAVTVKETLAIVGCLVAIDVTILTVWTILDPLVWQRKVTNQDKFGYTLESHGFCTSNNWKIYGGLIAALNFCLLGFASYLCYSSRHISTLFSKGTQSFLFFFHWAFMASLKGHLGSHRFIFGSFNDR